MFRNKWYDLLLKMRSEDRPSTLALRDILYRKIKGSKKMEFGLNAYHRLPDKHPQKSYEFLLALIDHQIKSDREHLTLDMKEKSVKTMMKSGGKDAAPASGKQEDPERDLSALSAAARAKATFPARILEYVGLRSKMYSILTAQPDGARKEKRKIKGVPKKAVTNVRHLEYREVLEDGSERRATFAQLRSRAREIAVETVEKKSLSPFNDKVYGLDAHNSRPLGHWRNLEQLRMLGAYAPPGSRALRPRDGVPRGAPASGARSDTAAAAEPMLGVDCRNRKKRSRALAFSPSRFLDNTYSIRRSCSR